jgi:hypothetical protein
VTFRTDAHKPGRWREVPTTPEQQRTMVNAENHYLRCYLLGTCTVVVTRELGQWHMSIAHQSRYPTWDEVATARYNAIPDAVTMAMLLPPRSEYVNLHRFCFQLHEVKP